MNRFPQFCWFLVALAAAISTLNGIPTSAGESDPSLHVRYLGARDDEISDDPWLSPSETGGCIAVEAYLSKERAAVGKPILLIMSIQNRHEQPITVPQVLTTWPFSVWMWDAAGKPVGKMRSGWENKEGRALDYRNDFFLTEIKPGFAMGIKIPLEKCFDLSQPGKYTVRASFDDTYSQKLSFELMPRGRKDVAEKKPSPSGAVAESPALRATDVFDQRWQSALAAAGRPRRGQALAASVWPLDGRSANLVVSLTNVGTEAVPTPRWTWSRDDEYSSEDSIRITAGLKASDYQILVRDASGRPVDPTTEGRTWLTRHESSWEKPHEFMTGMAGLLLVTSAREPRTLPKAAIRPGDAFGFVMPFDRVFAVNAGQEYSVLVVLPGDRSGEPPWVSGLVKIRVAEPEIAGVNRPLYGSDRVWERLMRTAGEPCSDIALESKLELKNWVPWLTVRMKNCASHPIRRNVRERNGIVLIRDASGSHVPRYGDKPCGLQGGTYSGGRELSPGEAAADGACDLSDEYHLCPGHRYTVLAAVTFDHGEPQDQGNLLVVAKPMSFTAPEPYIRFDRPPESMEATVASDPPHRLWLTPEEQWRSQSRFAGKQFGGLILESLAGKGADLKVALRNTTNERMLLARWNSESKYEILVRDAAGRLVPVTEKGKSFFGSGKILDFQILKPREAIEASFPIGELFDMRFPGDYTILASVPVIGDVDAVLTAAPVKVRIEPEPPAPKK